MCTISIIPLRERTSSDCGYRVVCNRDESRIRPPASNPRWRAAGAGKALWPMDMEAGGTWIAISEAGMTLCVLNVNPDPPAVVERPANARSRGLLIPELIGEGSVAAALERLERMPLSQYTPFRLLGIETVDGEMRLGEARWDRGHFGVAWFGNDPAAFSSSGLGDSRALPRVDLFEDLVVRPGATPSRQDEYHRHVWEDRPEVSVLMTREDARTVSITTVEMLAGRGPQMLYEPIPAAVSQSVAAR
jgi:hypothetical protein